VQRADFFVHIGRQGSGLIQARLAGATVLLKRYLRKQGCNVIIRVTRFGEFSPLGQLFTLDSLFKNFKSSTNCVLLFNTVSFAVILTKEELGYIFGPFFTNGSGHPGYDLKIFR
jgi:hypothetical protein